MRGYIYAMKEKMDHLLEAMVDMAKKEDNPEITTNAPS